MNPLSVLLVHSFWHPRGGDTTSLAHQRAALSARGHRVVPFGARHPDNLAESGDERWPGWVDPAAGFTLARLWSAGAARALDRVLKGHAAAGAPVDVAHVHHLHRHLTPAIFPVLQARRVPVVWTLHDYELTCTTAHHYRAGAPCFACDGHPAFTPALRHGCTRTPEGSAPSPLRRATGAAGLVAEKVLHRLAHATDPVSAFIAPSVYLADRVRPALPGARIEHLPNPLPVRPLTPTARSGVLFAGRLVEEKGVLDVLAVARMLPDVPFTVLGDGPLRSALTSVGLPNLRAPGAVGRAEVDAASRSAAVVLVPSRWPENDPYAVTEAQAAGAVVVASALGGIPEQVRHGDDGLLCAPGAHAEWAAAVRGVLANPAEAHRIGVRAHERVRSERDPARTAIALERLYQSVRSRDRSPA